MFSGILVKLAIDIVMDLILKEAAEAVKDTDNDIDDIFVETLAKNKDLIKARINKDGVKRDRRKGKRRRRR